MANFSIAAQTIVLDSSIDSLTVTSSPTSLKNTQQVTRSADTAIFLFPVTYSFTLGNTPISLLTYRSKIPIAGPTLNLNLGTTSGGYTLPTTGQIWPRGI